MHNICGVTLETFLKVTLYHYQPLSGQYRRSLEERLG